MSRRTERAAVALALVAIASGGSGCSPQINIGSSLLWSARHETADFTEWTAASKGGFSADTPDTAVVISTDVAHSGTHSVKLTNGAPATYVPAYETARLWRQDDFPTEAYYSAWFYLPQLFETTADWIVMQLSVPSIGDAAAAGQLIDIDLRSVPAGDMILTVYDHRAAYLRSPSADPALPVPIAQWFQIELFYRNVGDDSGQLTLWLDGQVNYDIHRPFGLSSTTYWSVCSSTEGLTPTVSDLYIDDAAVSLVRVGPSGSF
jgi:hypothetical protein